MGDGPAGGLVDEVVDTLPLAQDRIEAFALFDGLVGAGGVDLVGCLAVHPVVGAAQAGPLRAHRADMVGGE